MNKQQDYETMVKALRILSSDIESEDGVANACIADAAIMIEQANMRIAELERERDEQKAALEIVGDKLDLKSTDCNFVQWIDYAIIQQQIKGFTDFCDQFLNYTHGYMSASQAPHSQYASGWNALMHDFEIISKRMKEQLKQQAEVK